MHVRGDRVAERAGGDVEDGGAAENADAPSTATATAVPPLPLQPLQPLASPLPAPKMPEPPKGLAAPLQPKAPPSEHVGVHPMAAHMHASTIGLGDEHVGALRDYTRHEVALPMNSAVRANPSLQGLEPEHAANYQRIQAAIKAAGTLPQPVETWRGVDHRFSSKMLAAAQAAITPM